MDAAGGLPVRAPGLLGALRSMSDSASSEDGIVKRLQRNDVFQIQRRVFIRARLLEEARTKLPADVEILRHTQADSSDAGLVIQLRFVIGSIDVRGLVGT